MATRREFVTTLGLYAGAAVGWRAAGLDLGAWVPRDPVPAATDCCTSVTSFGAVGDGETDCTTAVQAALDANPSGTVYFPPGRYRTRARLRIPSNVRITGQGAVILPELPADAAWAEIVGASNIVFDGLEVEGAHQGITIGSGASRIVFHRCTFRSLPSGTLQQVIWLFDCSDIQVLNCRFQATGYGVIVQAGHRADNVLVSGNYFEDMRNDAVEQNSESVTCHRWVIANNIVDTVGVPGGGIFALGFGITRTENLVIVGNSLYNTHGLASIHIENAVNFLVTGNYIERHHGGFGGIYLVSEPTSGNVVGNTIKDCEIGITGNLNGWAPEIAIRSNYIYCESFVGNVAMDLRLTNRVAVSDNLIRNYRIGIQLFANRDCSFQSNTIYGAATEDSQGIVAAGPGELHRVVVQNNHIVGTGREGILLHGLRESVVSQNVVSGCGSGGRTAGLSLRGAGNHVEGNVALGAAGEIGGLSIH